MTSLSFPDFYASMYPHMVLVKTCEEGKYMLCPPNQMDWIITLQFLPQIDKWYVHGIREDNCNRFEERCEFESMYERYVTSWRHFKNKEYIS